MPARTPLALAAATLALAVGCDAPLSFAQRLEGEWVGRPEPAAERIVREWPTRATNPDDPEIARAAAAAPPTDLERVAAGEVLLEFLPGGSARLALEGEQRLQGEWRVVASDGRRGVLELSVDRGSNARETRRFDLEQLIDAEGFVLREQGADRQFGRLLFLRPSASAPARSGSVEAAPPSGVSP